MQRKFFRVWCERSVELHRSVVALKDRDRTQYCIPAGIHRKTLHAWRLLSTSCHRLEPIISKNQLCSPRINDSLFMFIICSSFCENIIWSPTRRKSRRFVSKIWIALFERSLYRTSKNCFKI